MSTVSKIVLAVVVVLVIAGAGVWFVVLRDTAPEVASIDAIDVPTTTGAPGGSAASPTSDGATPDGTWTVVTGDDVFVGYRIDEQFVGETITKTAAGRTTAVEGSMDITDGVVTDVSITADVTGLASDETRRDDAIGSRGLQTDQFPEATFTLTSPVVLPSPLEEGREVTVAATGDLTLHGVTRPVTLDLIAKWAGGAITVAGSTPVVLADHGMEVVEIPGFVKTADHGVLELQLALRRA